jgi:hypothetical protein
MDTNEVIGAIDAEIQRLQAAKALLDGSPTTKLAAKPSRKFGKTKDERSRAGTDRGGAESQMGEGEGERGLKPLLSYRGYSFCVLPRVTV